MAHEEHDRLVLLQELLDLVLADGNPRHHLEVHHITCTPAGVSCIQQHSHAAVKPCAPARSPRAGGQRLGGLFPSPPGGPCKTTCGATACVDYLYLLTGRQAFPAARKAGPEAQDQAFWTPD